MRLSLLQRTIAMIILIAALLQVSLAWGGLPGPLPPAPLPSPRLLLLAIILPKTRFSRQWASLPIRSKMAMKKII